MTSRRNFFPTVRVLCDAFGSDCCILPISVRRDSAQKQSEPCVTGPISNLRVIELGTLIAAPFAARLLAEFGADVIKIEPPDGGDPLRTWRKMHGGTSLWWYLQSRNKRCIGIDLRQPEGQEIVRRLVTDADVVIENFRPGTLERWGLGWDVL